MMFIRISLPVLLKKNSQIYFHALNNGIDIYSYGFYRINYFE